MGDRNLEEGEAEVDHLQVGQKEEAEEVEVAAHFLGCEVEEAVVVVAAVQCDLAKGVEGVEVVLRGLVVVVVEEEGEGVALGSFQLLDSVQ